MSSLSRQIADLRVSLTGRFIYHFLPWRRNIVLNNIDRVYAEQLTLAEKKRLAKAFYSHIATSIREAFQLRFMSEEKLKSRVEVRGHEHMLNIVAREKGVLVLTGHFGNWEFAPLGGVLNFKEFQGQFHFIRRSLGFKKLENILFRRYYKAGLNVIPKQDALHRVGEALDKNHAVIFVLDQHARITNRDGIAVEFFGQQAGTYRSLATFARHTGIPVVPAASYRLPGGKHVLEFYEPVHWEECASNQESLYTNTLKYNQVLEKIILAHPEQWIWLHKRWKLTS